MKSWLLTRTTNTLTTMGASQDTTPQPSEKDLLQAHYKQQEQQEQHRAQNQEFPPTPTSISLGSPVSPLSLTSAGSNSIHPGPLSETSNTKNHVPKTPPPYSGPVGSNRTPTQQPTISSTPGPPQKYAGLPALNYHLYSPPLFELSADRTTLKSTAPYLSTSASALISLVRAQATIPPKPQIYIIGRRSAASPRDKPDFALKLNLLPLLVPDDAARRMDYLRCVGAGERALRGGVRASLEPDLEGLEAWARRFVEDRAAVKAFVLERVVANVDWAWLEGQVRSLVAAMGYKGSVSVTFPVTHARVVVQSPHRVNRFFTGLTELFAGRREYEVVQAVWPFASCGRGEARGEGRVCAVQSEEQWWREWAGPIRFAIAGRRNGWVTNEDKLEAVMEGKGKGLAKVDWASSGEEGVEGVDVNWWRELLA